MDAKRQCSKCKQEVSTEGFRTNYCRICDECKRAKASEEVRQWQAKNPEKMAAQKYIREQIRCGLMPSPKELKCARCHSPAHVYHHRCGYLEKHWGDVEPLCWYCHGRAHNPPGCRTTKNGKKPKKAKQSLYDIVKERFPDALDPAGQEESCVNT
jgi:hypothetical protein